MMKNIYLTLACLFVLGFTTSCGDYLDVRPQGEKVENDLFETPQGFESAIYGVYGSLSDNSLYGQDLLWGITELLAQNLRSDSQFGDDMCTYQYKKNTVTANRLLSLWTNAYKSIGYANNVIRNLDQREPSSMELYNYYKGEMLAVRALIHFDLLRLFAPTVESQRGIPYVTTFDFSVKPFCTVGECYTKIIQDLTEAEQLLAGDAQLMVFPRNNDRYDQFLNFRETHMNLYAVKSLLARVNWYRGNLTEAANYASQVIDSQVFPLVDVTEVKDYLAGVLSPKETIFGIYSTKYLDVSKNYLYNWTSYYSYSPYDDISGQTHIEPWVAVYAADVDGTAQDLRRQQFRQGTGLTHCLKLVDFKTLDGSGRDQSLIAGMTVMHSSELYLIASEGLLTANTSKAREYFNAEITSRGLPALTDADVLTQERIYNEYHKELFCEGQLWFNMKRLNRDITSNRESRVIPASDEIYVLPIPDEEFEYRNE